MTSKGHHLEATCRLETSLGVVLMHICCFGAYFEVLEFEMCVREIISQGCQKRIRHKGYHLWLFGFAIVVSKSMT